MKYKVSLNGKTYEVEVERGEAILVDAYDTPAVSAPVAPVASAPAPAAAPAAPAPAAVSAAGEVVAAPMPGNILDVKVSAGQTVKKGEVLVILEAMKMENDIMAPRDGTVVQIVAAKGAKVDTGTPLVILS